MWLRAIRVSMLLLVAIGAGLRVASAADVARVGGAERTADGAAWVERIRFSFQTGGPIRGTPIVYDGVLYVGSGDGFFYAIDATTGVLRWRRGTGGAVVSTAAAGAGSVYFSSRDGRLYSVRATDGALLWSHRFGRDLTPFNYWDYFLSSPTLVGTSVYIGSGDGHAYALDARSGRIRWTFDAGSRIRSTVVVRDGVVVFGTMDGHVYGLRQRDGSPLWKFATAGASKTFADEGNDTTSVFASPAASNGRVAIGGRDGQLYAIDLADGREAWHKTHDGSSWVLSATFDNSMVYSGSGSALFVEAADAATGATRWRFKTRGAVFSSLTVAGPSLLFADFSGTVHAVDKATGQPQWQFPMRGRSLSTPIVVDGTVYCASDSGVLFALAVAPKPPTRVEDARRIVYSEGAAPAGAFGWFQNGVDAALLAQLRAAGYEQLDARQLAAFMREQRPESPRSVVVFADNRIPQALADAGDGVAPVRGYLNAGGKVALLGPNPLAYVVDPASGALTDIDFSIPARVFDVRYPELRSIGGYYASSPTAAGKGMGLRSFSVGYPAVDPDQALTPLALDEYGKASAWLKGYGGAEGSGLLQLALARQELPDIAELRAVIEYGVMW